eukprot:1157280-Pelagomonas_calceolata.AAC.8
MLTFKGIQGWGVRSQFVEDGGDEAVCAEDRLASRVEQHEGTSAILGVGTIHKQRDMVGASWHGSCALRELAS